MNKNMHMAGEAADQSRFLVGQFLHYHSLLNEAHLSPEERGLLILYYSQLSELLSLLKIKELCR